MLRIGLPLAATLLSFLSPAQSLNFRTDGYYYWDNGIDTLQLIPMNNTSGRKWSQVMMAEIDARNAAFGEKSTTDLASCIPDSAIPSGRSLQVKILSFFNGTNGTATMDACWDATTRRQTLDVHKKRKEGFGKKRFSPDAADDAIVGRVNPDNSFMFTVGPSSSHVQQVYTGKLYADRIVVSDIAIRGNFKIFTEQLRGHAHFPMVFRFYRFNQTPPPTKSLTLVYLKPL